MKRIYNTHFNETLRQAQGERSWVCAFPNTICYMLGLSIIIAPMLAVISDTELKQRIQSKNFVGVDLSNMDLTQTKYQTLEYVFQANTNFTNANLSNTKLYFYSIQQLPVIPPPPLPDPNCELPPCPPLNPDGSFPPLPSLPTDCLLPMPSAPSTPQTITIITTSDFTGANFTNANLKNAVLTDPVSLMGPNLTGVILTNAIMDGANIAHAKFGNGQKFDVQSMPGIIADGIIAPNAVFTPANTNITPASFRHAHLNGAIFGSQNIPLILDTADFTAAYIPSVSFNLKSAKNSSFETAYVNASTSWNGTANKSADMTGVNFTELQRAPLTNSDGFQTTNGNLLPDTANEGAAFNNVILDSGICSGITVGNITFNNVSAVGTTFANANIASKKPWQISNGCQFYTSDFSNGKGLGLNLVDNTSFFTAANFKNTPLTLFNCNENPGVLAQSVNTDTATDTNSCTTQSFQGEF